MEGAKDDFLKLCEGDVAPFHRGTAPPWYHGRKDAEKVANGELKHNNQHCSSPQ